MSHVDHDIVMRMSSLSPDVTGPTGEICWGKQGDGLLSLSLEGGGGGGEGGEELTTLF